jgi:hypothetical protein
MKPQPVKQPGNLCPALEAGALFPPIKIQRVFNYSDGQEATIVLEGNHRCEAFQEKSIQEIPAIEWKDLPLDYAKYKIPLLLESAQCNTSQKIAETTQRTQGRIAQIINNTSFGKINNLLSQGREFLARWDLNGEAVHY